MPPIFSFPFSPFALFPFPFPPFSFFLSPFVASFFSLLSLFSLFSLFPFFPFPPSLSSFFFYSVPLFSFPFYTILSPFLVLHTYFENVYILCERNLVKLRERPPWFNIFLFAFILCPQLRISNIQKGLFNT